MNTEEEINDNLESLLQIENNNNTYEYSPHNDDNYCVICLEDIRSHSSYTFDCSHELHVECFHKYFFYNYDIERNYISCPICKTELNVKILPKKEIKCTTFCKYFIIIFCLSTIGLSFIPQFQDLPKH